MKTEAGEGPAKAKRTYRAAKKAYQAAYDHYIQLTFQLERLGYEVVGG